MSGGGPPHHPHNRHVPPANSAWNHLPVPNYYPRQPQVAHMQAEHPLLHQASWHTPTTTDAMKLMPHSQMLNEMFKNEGLFPRDCVDLSLTRNGNQNGEVSSTPTAISLSVRDTSKINSLPPSMLDIQAVELTKCASPNLKSAISPGSIRTSSMSPGLKIATSPGMLGSGPAMKSLSPGRKSLSPGPKSSSPGLNLGGVVLPTAAASISALEIGKNQKRSNIRVDSILERLNPTPEKTFPFHDTKHEQLLSTTVSITPVTEKSQTDKPPSQSQSVIVSAATSYDENSNSSGTTNVPTPKEEDSASMHSNEDSLDSTKSRRKRKPSKTIRVNKEDEIKTEKDQVSSEVSPTDLHLTNHKEEPTETKPQPSDPAVIATILEGTTTKLPDRLESTADELDGVLPVKTRRKASSESETIDNIAAMVQEGLKVKDRRTDGVGDEERKMEDAVIKPDTGEAEKEIELPVEPKDEVEDMPDKIPTPTEESCPELDVSATVTVEEGTTYENGEDVSQSVSVDTIDGLDTKESDSSSEQVPSPSLSNATKPVTVSVIKTKEVLEETLSSGRDASPPEAPSTIENVPAPPTPAVPPLVTPAQKKASITHFVEVENKLEEMFAGIVEEDHTETPSTDVALEPLKNDSTLGLIDDSFMKLDDSVVSSKQESDVSDETRSPQEELASLPKQELKKEEFEDKKAAVKKARRNRPPSKRESDLDGEVPSKKNSVVSSKQESDVSDETRSPQEELASLPKQELKKEEFEDKKAAVKKARRNRPPSKRESDLDGEVPSKKKRLTKAKGVTTPSKKPPRSPAGAALKSPKKTPVSATLNRTPTKSTNSDVIKDVFAYDSGSNASSSKSRGPFVQIRGPRDSPLSVSVVNTPFAGEEDGERKSTKHKKFHDDSEYRHKVRSKGLHCSTLSNKYDAERKDTSWICAFCKRGPHASELTGPSVISEVPPPGDLFGPYFITTQCPEFEKRLDDPYDRQFKSRKITKVLDAAATSTKPNKKAKRKSESSSAPADVYLGMTDTGNDTYEVWTHEDCMVWSSGVYLVGPKIAGLEEAVWTCSNMPCAGCGLRGANLTCVKRGCLDATHLCCARRGRWDLDEANFKAYCPAHSRS